MAKKKQLEINVNNGISKTYDLKNVSDIVMIYNNNIQNDLKISVSGSTMTVKACGNTITYKFKNISNSLPINIKNDNGTKQFEGNLNDLYNQFGSFNDYTTNKNIVTGTMFSDVINVHNNNSIEKGYTINAGKGDDTITGTIFADTITAGAGNNIINYTKGDGNDIIKLTNKETLTINMSNNNGEYTINDLRFAYANKNKDLKIYTDKNSNSEFITLKNFATKDITGTGSVLLNIGGKTYNLETSKDVTNPIKPVDVVLYKTTLTGKGSNVTGTWLNEVIDASAVEGRTQKVKKQVVDVSTNKGLTLNGGAGNDTITGSKYSDTINGGAGDDTIYASNGNDSITGGSGNNKIIYSASPFGKDTITLTKNETLTITGLVFKEGKTLATSCSKNRNNLLIDTEYGQVVLKNYYTKNTGATVYIGETNLATTPSFETVTAANYFEKNGKIKAKYTGTALADSIDASGLTRQTKKNNIGVTINSSYGNDIIIGSKFKDTIKGGAGDDIITGGKENDKLYGEGGKNTFIFNNGDGDDKVYSGKGTDTLKFASANDLTFTRLGKRDLVIKYNYQNNVPQDSVTIKNYYDSKGKKIVSSVKFIEVLERVYNIETLKQYVDKEGKLPVVVDEDYNHPDDNTNHIVIADNTTEGEQNITTGDGDDIIYASENGVTNINAGNGNNEVYGGNGGTIVTGNDDDIIYSGNSTSINAGGGNDTIHLEKDSNVIHLGDNLGSDFGHDTVIFDDKQEEGNTIVFDDKTLNEIQDENTGVTFKKDGNDLIIKQDDNNSVTLADYLNQENTNISETTIKGSDGETSSLTDLINNKGVDVTGEGVIEGTKYNDNIQGSDNNDVIYTNSQNTAGGVGSNVIDAGKGDDTIHLQESHNEIHIGADNGKDIVIFEEHQKNGNTIIFDDKTLAQIHGEDGITFKKDGDDLVIQKDENNSITIENYFNKNNQQNISETTIKGNDEIEVSTTLTQLIEDKGIDISGAGNIEGTKYNDNIQGSDNNDVINGGEGNDTITSAKGNDTITGGKGNDTLIGNNDGIKTFVFNENDGADNITGAKIGDIIQINTTSTPVITKITEDETDKLQITYNGGTIVTNYDFSAQNNVDSLQFKNPDGSYQTISIKENISLQLTGTDENNNLAPQEGQENYNYIIQGGEGADTLKGGTKNNTFIFELGDGDDTILNSNGTDTLVFEEGTKIIKSKSEDGNDLLITYSGVADETPVSNTITAEDYYNTENHSVKYFKIGNTTYSFGNYYCLSRGDEALADLTVSNGSPVLVTLVNPFGAENYQYTIATEQEEETFSLQYLKNGRLKITGNNINVTASSGQVDDIILYGDYNHVETGDLNDIVRLGGAIDMGDFEGANHNIVNTGSGNDHVQFAGLNNTINTSDGEDSVIAINSSNTNTITNAEFNRVQGQNEPYTSVDGALTTFNQAGIGDCRVLSMIESLAQKNAMFGNSNAVTITDNENGSYTVTFNKYNRVGKANSTIVTKAEIANFSGVYGDIDVVLTDIAINKLLKQNGDSTYARNRSYVETATYNVISEYFFGSTDMAVARYTMNYFQMRIGEFWGMYRSGIVKNINVGFEGEDNIELGIIGGHSYAIKNINTENGYITLINPWDNKDVVNLDFETFFSLEANVYIYGYKYNNENYTINNLPSYNYTATNAQGETIIGGEVNDTLTGIGGNDTIIANEGNDTITTGEGNDILYFQTGDGKDVITDASATDKIVFAGENLSLESLSFARGEGASTSLFITYGNDPCEDVIEIQNYFTFSNEEYVKRDGTIEQFGFVSSFNPNNPTEPTSYYTFEWKKSPTGEYKMYNVISGNDSTNILTGSSQDDIITGKKGNDTINAGAGNNVIKYSLGDGNDTIISGGGVDTLVFEAGTEVNVTYSGNDVLIIYGNGETSNTITLKDYQTTTHSVQKIKVGNDEIQNIIDLVVVSQTDFYNFGGDPNYNSRGVWGTNSPETLMATNAGNDPSIGESYHSYGGNDKLVLRKTYTVPNGPTVDIESALYFKPGDGHDTVINANRIKEGAAEYSEEQAKYQAVVNDGEHQQVKLRFVNVNMNDITAEVDENDIILHYTANDSVRIVGGYYSTEVYSIDAYTLDHTKDNLRTKIYSGDLDNWTNTRTPQTTVDYGAWVNGPEYIIGEIQTKKLSDLVAGLSINNSTQESAQNTTGWMWNDTITTSNYGDTVKAYGGDDVVNGGNGADSIYGGAGDDALNGGAGNDRLYGEAGNDTIHGGEGNDYINPGDGNDVVYGDAGDDTLIGSHTRYLDNNDLENKREYFDSTSYAVEYPATVYGGAGSDTIYGYGTIYADNVTISGNTVTDIEAGAGNDYVYGAGTIYTGYGSDTVDYVGGYYTTEPYTVHNGFVDTGAGNDTINLNILNSAFYGATVNAGTGDDYITGRAYNYDGYQENNIVDLDAGAGNDHVVITMANSLELDGGAGNDLIEITPFVTQTMNSNSSHVVIRDAGGDNDTLVLTEGNGVSHYTYVNNEGIHTTAPLVYFDLEVNANGSIKSTGDNIYIIASKNEDVTSSDFTWANYADTTKAVVLENALVAGKEIENIYIKNKEYQAWNAVAYTNKYAYRKLNVENLKAAYANYLHDNGYTSIANALATGGNAAKEALARLSLGDDIWQHTMYRPQFETDVEAVYGDGETTVLNTEYGYAIGSDANETITLLNPTATSYLDGKAGNDTITGNTGDDVIIGGTGNDILTGGSGADKFYFRAGDGKDVITDATSADALVFIGVGFEAITLTQKSTKMTSLFVGYDSGEGYDEIEIPNYFVQTENPDYIPEGQPGYDPEIPEFLYTVAENVVNKFGFTDKIIGDNQILVEPDEYCTYTMKDPIVPDEAQTLCNIINGNYYDNELIGDNNIINYINGKGGNDTITGGNMSDIIYGGDGNDTINSGDGDDKIYGGDGNDTINAGTGNNKIYYNTNDDKDVILNGGGNDTLVLPEGLEILAYYGTGDSANDLIITYLGTQDYWNSVTLKDYRNGHSVQTIQIGDAQIEPLSKYVAISLPFDSFEDVTFTRGNGNSTDLLITGSYWDHDENQNKEETITVKNYFKLEGGKYVKSDDAPTRFKLNEYGTKIYNLEWRVSPQNGVEGMYNIVTGKGISGTTVYGASYINNWVEPSRDALYFVDRSPYTVLMPSEHNVEFQAFGGEIEALGGAGNDIIEASSGDDYIDGGAGSDTIKPRSGDNIIRFKLGESNGDILIGNNGKDTLVFDAGTTVNAAWGEEDTEHENDMLVTCSGTINGHAVTDTIIIKDYKTDPNAGTKYVKIGDGDAFAITKFLPPGEGTMGDDDLESTAADEHFNLMTGNDTIRFGKDFGNDTIDTKATSWTFQTEESNTTDTYIFSDYYVKDGGLDFDINSEGNLIITAQDGTHGGTVTVNNFASPETPNLHIYDAGTDASTENARKMTSYDAYGFTVNAEKEEPGATIQHVVKSISSDTYPYALNSIFSMTGDAKERNGNKGKIQVWSDIGGINHEDIPLYNKHVFATTGGISMDYWNQSYARDENGNLINYADDTCITYGGNDNYEVYYVDNSTRLRIKDSGGNDTIQVRDDKLESLRLLFNVNADGTYDNVNFKVVNTNMIDGNNFKEVYNSDILGIRVTATADANGGEGIERILAAGHSVTNVSEWKGAIATAVGQWLTTNNFTDVEDALAHGTSAQITQLYNKFNTDYTATLTSRTVSNIQCYQPIFGGYTGYGSRAFGTDESENILMANAGGDDYRIYTGKGNDTVTLAGHYFTYLTQVYSGPSAALFFKPGDGNDSILNSDTIVEGGSVGEKTEEQMEYSEDVLNHKYTNEGDTSLYFKDVDLNNLHARQDGNDILITYTTGSTTDTVRIKNGYYSTNVRDIITYVSDYDPRQAEQKTGGYYLYENDEYVFHENPDYNEFATVDEWDDHGNPLPAVQIYQETGSVNLKDIIETDAINNQGGATAILEGWIWKDNITAGDNGDTIYAYNGNDSVTGGAGNDTIYGGYGDDTINGNGGDDTIEDTDGLNTIHGNSGNDTITATGLVYGDEGDDNIEGAGKLYGGIGNDKITSTGRAKVGTVDDEDVYAEYVDGGDGNDNITIYSTTSAPRNVDIHGGKGDDTLTQKTNWYSANTGSYHETQSYFDNFQVAGTIDMGEGHDYVQLNCNITSDITIDGGVGDDVIEIAAPYLPENFNKITIKNSGGHDAINIGSAYNRVSFDYFTFSYTDYSGESPEKITKIYAPVAYFDMEKINGNWTYGNDIYLASTATDRYVGYDGGAELEYQYIGDKEQSLKLTDGLVADHDFDVYIKNNEYIGGSDTHLNGYRLLDVDRLKEKYQATLTELGYTSLNAALTEADAVKQQANRVALATAAMADDVWVYTLDRPVEFSLMKDGTNSYSSDNYRFYKDFAKGNGAENNLVMNLAGRYELVNGNNFFAGTDAKEFLYSTLNGDDIIRAGGGNDVIYGGAGNDQIYAGSGNNRIVFANNYYVYGGYNEYYGSTTAYTVNESISRSTSTYNYGTNQYEYTYTTDGHDIVYNDGGTNTLDFTENNMVKFDKVGSDLKISYAFEADNNANVATSTVTVKDYFLANGTIDPNHSAKFIKFKSRGVVNLADEYTASSGNKYMYSTTAAGENLQGNLTTEFIYGGSGNDTLSSAKYLDGGAGNDIYEALGSGALTVISDSGHQETNYIRMHDTSQYTICGFCDVTATKTSGNVATTYGNSIYLYNGAAASFSPEEGIRVDVGYTSLLNEDFDTSGYDYNVIINKSSNLNNTNYKVVVYDEYDVARSANIDRIKSQTASWLSNNYDAVATILGEGNVSSYNLMTSDAAGASVLKGEMISSITSSGNMNWQVGQS